MKPADRTPENDKGHCGHDGGPLTLEERCVRSALCRIADELTVKVQGCARCGGNHDDVIFRRLIRGETATEHWTHWATCPANGEPIMMRAENQ